MPGWDVDEEEISAHNTMAEKRITIAKEKSFQAIKQRLMAWLLNKMNSAMTWQSTSENKTITHQQQKKKRFALVPIHNNII